MRRYRGSKPFVLVAISGVLAFRDNTTRLTGTVYTSAIWQNVESNELFRI